MKIVIGADHGGVEYKDSIVKTLKELNHEVVDYGTYSTDSVDYPDYAKKVCKDIKNKNADFGVLICGTGIGMSIAANKTNGVRCALVNDPSVAKITREHNDTNVVALGARVISLEDATNIVLNFINEEFSNDERHINRIRKVMEIENE